MRQERASGPGNQSFKILLSAMVVAHGHQQLPPEADGLLKMLVPADTLISQLQTLRSVALI